MKVTAVTRFKQGDLYNALKKLGWTQVELSRRSGVKQQVISHALNLRNKPSPFNIERIQKAFAEAGEYLDVTAIWPEHFKGTKNSVVVEQTKDVEMLPSGAEPQLLHDTMKPDLEGAREILENALSVLTERQATYLRAKYFDGKGVEVIAKEHGVTRANLFALEKKAFSRLRQYRPKEMREVRACLHISD